MHPRRPKKVRNQGLQEFCVIVVNFVVMGMVQGLVVVVVGGDGGGVKNSCGVQRSYDELSPSPRGCSWR